MSDRLLELAQDLATVKGTNVEEELAYLRAELTGEKEPIRWSGRRVRWWERALFWLRGSNE